jgi:hypothetical protein
MGKNYKNVPKRAAIAGAAGAVITAIGNTGAFVDPAMGFAASKAAETSIAANPTNPLLAGGIVGGIVAGKAMYDNGKRMLQQHRVNKAMAEGKHPALRREQFGK